MHHVKLAHQVFKGGSGPVRRPPLLLLHGLFGSKQNWQSLAKSMARSSNLTVVVADARNHGESPHSDVMTYKSMADDLLQLIGDLGYQEVDVLGHSMGGKTAMVLALSEKSLVRKLVVEDVAPAQSPVDLDFRRYIAAMKEVKVADGLSLAEARAHVSEQLKDVITSTSVRTFMLQNFVQRLNGSFGWRINLGGIAAHFDDLFGFPEDSTAYDGDSLFIGGSQSNYLRDLHGLHAKVRRLFPKAKFHEIEGAGHWVHSDKPYEFQRVVLGFLAG